MKAAVYTATRNLYEHVVPAIKSLLYNSDVERVYLLIEDDVFPVWLPPECEIINISGQTIFIDSGPNYKSRYTYMAMVRAALTMFLPDELDRVLSLDVDTIVDSDISSLWELPIEDYYFAGAHEWHETTEKFLYINAGVMLCNLAKLRDGKTDELVKVLNTKRYNWLEQDVINIYCQGYLYDMPAEYNNQYYTDKVDNPKIYHHIGDNSKLPSFPDVQKYARMSWEDVLRKRGSAK